MLQILLEQHRESIIAEWIDLTINSYEPEMVRFLKREKNPFANPVRSTIMTNIAKLFDGILNDFNMDECSHGLDEIIKLRAVQDFSPSMALAFIFDLKKILHEKLKGQLSSDELIKELYQFGEQIDLLTRMAFDIYTKYRNKIYEIRLSEIKSQSQRAFEMLGRPKK